MDKRVLHNIAVCPSLVSHMWIRQLAYMSVEDIMCTHTHMYTRSAAYPGTHYTKAHRKKIIWRSRIRRGGRKRRRN